MEMASRELSPVLLRNSQAASSRAVPGFARSEINLDGPRCFTQQPAHQQGTSDGDDDQEVDEASERIVIDVNQGMGVEVGLPCC